MEIIADIIFICVLYCLSIWTTNKIIKERERQYNKFLKDIADIFNSAMNQKKEEE